MVQDKFIKYSLAFIVLMLAVLAVHQGRSLDTALEELEKSKVNHDTLSMTVLNVQSEKSVTLDCQLGDTEGGTDYTMSVTVGGKQPVSYSCVHQTQDVLAAK